MKTCLWPGDEDGIDIEISKKEKKIMMFSHVP